MILLQRRRRALTRAVGRGVFPFVKGRMIRFTKFRIYIFLSLCFVLGSVRTLLRCVNRVVVLMLYRSPAGRSALFLYHRYAVDLV